MNLKQALASLSRLSRTGKSLFRGYIAGRWHVLARRTPTTPRRQAQGLFSGGMNFKQASASLSRLSRTGKSLFRGYIDGRVPAAARRTPPACPWRAAGPPPAFAGRLQVDVTRGTFAPFQQFLDHLVNLGPASGGRARGTFAPSSNNSLTF